MNRFDFVCLVQEKKEREQEAAAAKQWGGISVSEIELQDMVTKQPFGDTSQQQLQANASYQGV